MMDQTKTTAHQFDPDEPSKFQEKLREAAAEAGTSQVCPSMELVRIAHELHCLPAPDFEKIARQLRHLVRVLEVDNDQEEAV
jgi:hypothetical protein